MGRTIVIGDIHGCFEELQDLLKVVELRTDDRVIAVGDLIVKGPQNREVLDRFIEDDRFSAVIGNHDRAIRHYWRGEPVRLTKEQKETVAQLESGRERYSAYLCSLPFTINLGSHLVVHAGLRPGVPLRRQMSSDLTEMRTMGANPSSRKGVPWFDVYRGRRVVLFGHWPAKSPRVGRRALGLDTGCVYGGRLTAYIIELNQFFSVAARQRYVPKRKAPAKRIPVHINFSG